MAHELVTLESPDGRRYRTDSPAEINMLITSKGYTRIDDAEQAPQTSAPQGQDPDPAPEAVEPDTADDEHASE